MIAGLLAVPVLVLGAWGVGALLRIQFVNAMPITALGVMFALYLTYICGVLHAGWWLIVLVCLAGGIYGLLDLRKADSRSTELVPSAQVASSLVSLVVVVFFTYGRTVLQWDELRLWGAYPKLLYVDGGLQVGPDSLLMGEMQTYTPGMPLFGYFFEAFGPTFVDERLFLAYGVFAAALLMPLAARVTWSRPVWIVPAGVAVALLPLAYANYLADPGGDFYGSLFVDPIVGIGLGYLVWQLASAQAGRWMWVGQLGLTAGGLYLVKTSTLGLSAVVLIVAAVRWMLSNRQSPWRRRLIGLCLLVAPLLLAAGTWTLVQSRLGPGSKFDSLGHHFDLDLLNQYAKMLLGRPEFTPGIGMFSSRTSFVYLDVALLMSIGCLVVMLSGRERKLVATALATLIVIQILFLGGIYMLVVGPFAGEFQSFPRYTATMLTAASVVLALLLATKPLRSRTVAAKFASVLMSACLILLVLCFPLRKPVNLAWGWEARAHVDALKLRSAFSESDFSEEHPTATVIFRDDWLNKVGHHHSVYYELLDTGARIGMYLPATLTSRSSPTYAADVQHARDAFLRYVLDNNVRLIEIAEPNPELGRQFEDCFDQKPQAQSVYRVEVVQGGCGLLFHLVA
ncbi:hypothetical protein ACFQW6_12255 [Nocardioides sp. GCM10028917]|uniref:hypothetical protein n=1 Tax=Nocardioides sp. GCM10028917 TaxID=3273408 RepID=UPI003607F694